MNGWFINRRATAGLAVVVLALASVVLTAFFTTRSLAESIARTHETHNTVSLIHRLREGLVESEAARRGYALSGDDAAAEDFHESVDDVVRQLDRLEEVLEDDPAHDEHLDALSPLVDVRLENLRSGLEVIDDEQELAGQLQLTRDGLAQATTVHQILDAMENLELKLLDEHRREVEYRTEATIWLLMAGGALGVLMGGVVLLSLNRQMRARLTAEARLQEAHDELTRMLAESEARNDSVSFMSDLTGMLQACRTTDEVLTIVRESMSRAFPHQSGTLSLIKSSRNAVVIQGSWGGWDEKQPDFLPDDCWALRRGQFHSATAADEGARCKHVPSGAGGYWCAPLVAQSEALGVLTLAGIGSDWQSGERRRFAEMLAETIAMAMANLDLRERLVNQAITDPLTGLFNRRYMEETLTRELSRAERSGQPVSVILLDVDHFKKFNDTYGHQAGDELLRRLGEFLRGFIRSGDFACRFGGEEFALVMPGSPVASAVDRAEAIRARAHGLQVSFAGQPLGAITLSLGVACAPEHGTTYDVLVRQADEMLYEAKRSGRDRYCVAPAGTESVPED